MLGHQRRLRQQFANLNPGHGRVDRLELAANLCRAPGLGSHVECCAGPPKMNNRMHDLAREGRAKGSLAEACRSKSPSVNPATPSEPMRSISRREIPSHNREGLDVTVNMVGSPEGASGRSGGQRQYNPEVPTSMRRRPRFPLGLGGPDNLLSPVPKGQEGLPRWAPSLKRLLLLRNTDNELSVPPRQKHQTPGTSATARHQAALARWIFTGRQET